MDGHWEEFAPEANEQMLQAYLDYVREITGTQFVTISSGGVERQVDFKLMQQKHLRTGKTRGSVPTAAQTRYLSSPAAAGTLAQAHCSSLTMDAAADTLLKQLAAETQKRQRAEMLCQQALFQKANELAVEKEAR